MDLGGFIWKEPNAHLGLGCFGVACSTEKMSAFGRRRSSEPPQQLRLGGEIPSAPESLKSQRAMLLKLRPTVGPQQVP